MAKRPLIRHLQKGAIRNALPTQRNFYCAAQPAAVCGCRRCLSEDAYDSVKNGVIDRVSEVSQERKIKDMAKNPKATAKEIARRGVVAYIQESYDEFSEDQITKVFDDIYRKEKSPRDLKRETLTKLTSKKRSRRRMPNKSNTGKIEDNTLLSIEESVGDANNPI